MVDFSKNISVTKLQVTKSPRWNQSQQTLLIKEVKATVGWF